MACEVIWERPNPFYRAYSLKFVNVAADGNCLYRCLSLKLFGHPNGHDILRQQLIQCVSQNWHIYEHEVYDCYRGEGVTSLKEYMEKASKPTVWGSTVEIQAFAHLHRIVVVLWMGKERCCSTFGWKQKYSNHMHLWFSGNHFQYLKYCPHGELFGGTYGIRPPLAVVTNAMERIQNESRQLPAIDASSIGFKFCFQLQRMLFDNPSELFVMNRKIIECLTQITPPTATLLPISHSSSSPKLPCVLELKNVPLPSSIHTTSLIPPAPSILPSKSSPHVVSSIPLHDVEEDNRRRCLLNVSTPKPLPVSVVHGEDTPIVLREAPKVQKSIMSPIAFSTPMLKGEERQWKTVGRSLFTNSQTKLSPPQNLITPNRFVHSNRFDILKTSEKLTSSNISSSDIECKTIGGIRHFRMSIAKRKGNGDGDKENKKPCLKHDAPAIAIRTPVPTMMRTLKKKGDVNAEVKKRRKDVSSKTVESSAGDHEERPLSQKRLEFESSLHPMQRTKDDQASRLVKEQMQEEENGHLMKTSIERIIEEGYNGEKLLPIWNEDALFDEEHESESEEEVEVEGSDVIHQEIVAFKRLKMMGPSEGCDSCHTLNFPSDMVGIPRNLTVAQRTFIEKEKINIICRRCRYDLYKKKLPRFSSVNGFKLEPLQSMLNHLNYTEQRLISPRLCFLNLRQLGIGGQQGLKGGVVNVPIQVVPLVQSLPRLPTELHTLRVQVKRNVTYQRVVFDDNVRPNLVRDALKYLCDQPLFKEYKVAYVERPEEIVTNEDDGGTKEEVTTASTAAVVVIAASVANAVMGDATPNLDVGGDDMAKEQDIVRKVDKNEDPVAQEDETEDPVRYDTIYMQQLFIGDPTQAVMTVTPGANEKPLPLLMDPDVEELSFPFLFGGRRRIVGLSKVPKITYRDIAKWELENVDRRFATNMPNLFFKLYKLNLLTMNSIVGMRVRQYKKKVIQDLTAASIQDVNTREGLRRSDVLYNEFKLLRGSPAYYKNCRLDLYATLRQLGRPSFFLTLSMADTKWVDLHNVLRKLQKVDSPLESWLTITKAIRYDPVTCARYYTFRRNALFKTILSKKTNVFGHVQDFVILDEFQQRGSPHSHCLIWSKDLPEFNVGDTKTLISFIDLHISTSSKGLREDLVKLQTHTHSKSCQKKKGKEVVCRFHYPRFPFPETVILVPLEDGALHKQNVKRIREILNSCERNALEFEQFLERINISMEEYVLAVRSTLERPTVIYQRSYVDRFMNSYNSVVLESWEANIDVQVCIDVYAVASYIASYMTKAQKGRSQVMERALQLAQREGSNLTRSLRIMGAALVNNQEISAQEAVYLMLGLPLQKRSRFVQFINTGRPETRVAVVKPMAQILELDPTSKDIFHENALISRYEKRPQVMEDVCLAEFVGNYALVCTKENKAIHIGPDFSKKPLWYRKRKKKCIIRYPNPNRHRDTKEKFREKIFLYVPFRREDDLIDEEIVSVYQRELNSILRRELLFVKSIQDWDTLCIEAERHIEDTTPDGGSGRVAEMIDLEKELDIVIPTSKCHTQLQIRTSEDMFLKHMRQLNEEQLAICEHILHAVRYGDEPLRVFLSGGAGVGKSVVIRAVDMLLEKVFNSSATVDPTTLKILKLAPTGVAAFNIGGMTTFTGLQIPPTPYISPDNQRAFALNKLQSRLRDVKFVIIDEVSMVSANHLIWIESRLRSLTGKSVPFGGLHVLVVGDLFQLAPVRAMSLFDSPTISSLGGRSTVWQLFKMYELQTIMRQKEDVAYGELLNRIREGVHTNEDVEFLKSLENNSYIPEDAVYLFGRNEDINKHHKELFSKNSGAKHHIFAEDVLVEGGKQTRLQDPHTSKDITGKFAAPLPTSLMLYVNAKVQVATNINVEDGLVNGSTGIVKAFSIVHEKVVIVWVEFSNFEVGLKRRAENYQLYATYNVANLNYTPFAREVAEFQIGLSSSMIYRSQFPFRLADALTFHRAQGLTFSAGCVSFHGKAFEHGAYVALSRFQSHNRVILKGFSKEKIKINEAVKLEMARLRRNLVQCKPCSVRKDFEILHETSVVYHNVRSLRKYMEDVRSHPLYHRSNIVCLAETHLTSSDVIDLALGDKVKPQRFDSSSGGMVIYDHVGTHYKCHDSEAGHFLYRDIRLHDLNVLLIFGYRNPKLKIPLFLKFLSEFLNETPHSDVILVGDLNLPKPSQVTLKMFAKYRMHQLVQVPTHIALSTLDQVWSSVPCDKINISIRTSYFSDHSAIKLLL